MFSQCFNYEPSDPEMFSDKFGHGFSSFYEDVEQYELTVPEVSKCHSPALCYEPAHPMRRDAAGFFLSSTDAERA